MAKIKKNKKNKTVIPFDVRIPEWYPVAQVGI
jgi:hypothetical protein